MSVFFILQTVKMSDVNTGGGWGRGIWDSLGSLQLFGKGNPRTKSLLKRKKTSLQFGFEDMETF